MCFVLCCSIIFFWVTYKTYFYSKLMTRVHFWIVFNSDCKRYFSNPKGTTFFLNLVLGEINMDGGMPFPPPIPIGALVPYFYVKNRGIVFRFNIKMNIFFVVRCDFELLLKILQYLFLC